MKQKKNVVWHEMCKIKTIENEALKSKSAQLGSLIRRFIFRLCTPSILRWTYFRFIRSMMYKIEVALKAQVEKKNRIFMKILKALNWFKEWKTMEIFVKITLKNDNRALFKIATYCEWLIQQRCGKSNLFISCICVVSFKWKL